MSSYQPDGTGVNVCTLQELLGLSQATQVFEQIPLVAITKMRGVDWSLITVGVAFTPTDITS